MCCPVLHMSPAPAHPVLSAARATQSRELRVTPAWTQPGTPFRHTWEQVANVDQFRWMVRRDMQEQLELAQRELGVRHVRAVGMFDDEMRVFRPSPASFMGYESAAPRTNWQSMDYVIDSLLDRGLSPMFTTSFIPSALTSGPTTVFTTKGHTSPPDDWRAWAALVRESAQHAIERYGLAVVRGWYFEVWNEPNLHNWFWGGDKAQFLKLWQVTHNALKDVDASLRVGGPSCGRAEWIEDLMLFGAANNCRPDYLTAHVYNNDASVGEALAPFDGAQADRGSQSPNFAIGIMRGVRTQVDQLGHKGELHWNEWGRSFHGVDKRRESAAECAFIARLLGEVSQEADAFAYWCISDIYDQVGYGREAFHGGYGLLNLQGLRKPSYHTFQLLSRLGTERKPVPDFGVNALDGAIATVDASGRASVLVYAYQHDDVPVRQPLSVVVELPTGTKPGVIYRVDSMENNVVSRWQEMGAPDYLSRAQTAELQADNTLRASTSGVQVETINGRRCARFTMESPGVALLEIERE
ncbi:GH39 family glycosyl hydrolase [Nibricoccus aquaticus]|uniref:GH39 family glycosyl hydrolase n=1 Tax=Nibricoccus aquaticus TaxID=2576891 RepID=UPI0010FEBD29|nr:hypothetical protein [Nibricoccus aquaticus]